jgi:hypothetical protein
VGVNMTDWVWKHSRSKLAARLALLAIADYAHDEEDGADAWPSITTLATKTNLSITALRAAIKTLVDMGELEVIPLQGKRTPNGMTNRYRMLRPDYGHPRPKAKRDRGRPQPPDTGSETAGVPDPTPSPDGVQIRPQYGVENSTRADSAPLADSVPPGVRIPGPGGTDSVPRTVREPLGELKNPPPPDGAASNVTALRDYDPLSAQGMLQAWLDNCDARGWGRPAPSRFGRAARQLKSMLAAGLDPQHVRTGFAFWAVAEPSRSPDAIPEFVHDAQRGLRPGARANGSGFAALPATGTVRAQAARSAGERVQAMIDGAAGGAA